MRPSLNRNMAIVCWALLIAFEHATLTPLVTKAQATAPAKEVEREPLRPGRIAVPSFPLPTLGEARILQALDEPTSIHVLNLPLEEALSEIEQRSQIEIWIDKQTLQDAGITSDERVTLDLNQIPLRGCLKLLLQPLGLVCVLEDQVLKVTTAEALELKSTTRVYPIGDLLGKFNQSDVIPTMACGLGLVPGDKVRQLSVFTSTKSLTVRLPDASHEQVVNILRGLREAQIAQEGARGKVVADIDSDLAIWVPSFPLPSKLETSIQKALDDPTTVAWSDQPLSAALHDLSVKHQFNIWIDTKALGEEELNIETPVTIKGTFSLRECLRLLFEPLSMVYLIEDDVLKVTPATCLKRTLVTRIYSVGDLFSAPERGRDFVETLECGLSRTRGSDGYRNFVVSYSRNTLIVRDTYDFQEEVKHFLRSLRQAHQVSLE